MLGDYGSDINAIPDDIYQKVLQAEPSITVTTFEKPKSLSCAFKSDGQEDRILSFTASRSAKLNITIVLPGPGIPVRIRGVEFCVVDQPMDEVLIGRPFLNTIGFNLNDHLNNIHKHIHEKTIEEIDTANLKAVTSEYRGMSYQESYDDPIGLPDGVTAGIGLDSKESIDKEFTRIITEARNNGISEGGSKILSNTLEKYSDTFRIKLGPDPPAKVEPLVITPTDNAKPYRSPQRRYAPIQRDFIAQTIRELEAIGAIYKNPSARWASPALAVSKPGSDKLRFTVDLRGPKSRTVPIQSAMPHLESHLQDVAGSKCFASVDLAHGYWQVPLAEESQEMLSIQTPLGVYSSKRLLQGGSDSGNHFQAVLAQKFDGRVKRLLQWLDDFLMYAKNESQLLEDFEAFLSVCSEIGLKVHAEKTKFFMREAKFCGRIISAEGVKYHPRQFDSLLNMKRPTMEADLQQFLCATNWMRNSIPEYATRIEPLHKLLETCYKKAGKRTKRALRNLSITSLWGTIHDDTFASIKSQLAAAVKLAHPKPNTALCLFTDASETHWSAILTQVHKDQRRKEIEDQEHEPLCFLSGAFTGSSANWSMPEKEGFAVVEGMCRLDYLVLGRNVSVYTDHANLVYMYDPYGRDPGISHHTASKLMRWALKLSAFRYVVEHISGERNVWADMLTRWAVKPRDKVGIGYHVKALMYAPITLSLDEELDWPVRDEIINSQELAQEEPPKSFRKTGNGWVDDENRMWIPSSDDKLKLRILIAAHAGYGGHRGKDVTLYSIESQFAWNNMRNDVNHFVGTCLHCLATAPGCTVPRPLGHAMHAVEPNKLLHFDFCFISDGQDDYKYVLVMKDDHSGYVWLKPTTEATAEATAEHLINWFSSFGVVEQWVSDCGTHFKNELVKLLRERVKAEHHFTLAYCPWSNGTVEVVCRELLRATRALLSEYQLPMTSWPQVLPIVQSVLNNSMLKRLGNYCPLTAFTGLPQSTPLLSIKNKVNDVVKIHSISKVRAIQAVNTANLQESLNAMHKHVAERADARRRSAIAAHNRKTNVQPINFTKGDFVLRGARKSQRGRKPQLMWHGPFQVVKVHSEYIFTIKNLLNGKTEEAHGRRLKLFRNSEYQVTEELINHLAYQEGELLVIEEFRGIRQRRGQTELHVKWKGFDVSESDWISTQSLRDDVPVMLDQYLSHLRKNGTPHEKKLAASI